MNGDTGTAQQLHQHNQYPSEPKSDPDSHKEKQKRGYRAWYVPIPSCPSLHDMT